MATVTRENIGLLNDKITVKVSQEDYLPNFDKAVKQLSKTANIPGFRKGMVPAGMVKKMHGQAIFADEILKTVEKELMGYIQNEKLEIFAQPLSLDKEAKNFDHNSPAEYDFAFEVGLKPNFSVTPLEDGKTSLIRYKIKATPEMVNEEVERLQLRGGKSNEVESVTEDDNVLYLTAQEADAQGNVTEGGHTKETSFLFKNFTAAAQAQLKGKKKDDSIVIKAADAVDADKLNWFLHDVLGLHGD
ncbi:MAG TPA: trigger factor family protein, partial [Chitinophaga sp.]|nr:trigger factor family protein [Chitinophaga sp.]